MKTPVKRTTSRNLRPKGGSERRFRGEQILRVLRKQFPQPKTALRHENPFQLLVSTILSAQCTDERVNLVTQDLFKKFRSAHDFASARQADLEQEIRSTGFYRMKARNIIACCQALVERHGASVPGRMEDLIELPGVGRKTANVVLGQAYGLISGVVVDTHVHRVSQRLGLSAADDPGRIEQDLMEIFPRSVWIDLGSVLVLHGRKTCQARRPRCLECSVNTLCPSAATFQKNLR